MLEEGLEHGHVAVNTTIYCVIQQQQVANWKFIHEPMTTIFCESCKKKKKNNHPTVKKGSSMKTIFWV